MSEMTIPQLAREMGLSRIVVYNRVKSGQIPARRVGRAYLISPATVKRLLGKELTPAQRRWIDAAVRRVVAEYGDLLKCLGAE